MTRMWMVNPKTMCRNHLLGEHKELHQLVGTILLGRMNVVHGHAKKGQVQCRSIQSRHIELVLEMLSRGYNHQSPLPEFDFLDVGEIDLEESDKELRRRCNKCSSLRLSFL
jgi:hypothetical protein